LTRLGFAILVVVLKWAVLAASATGRWFGKILEIQFASVSVAQV
jgi:hypothetical protein